MADPKTSRLLSKSDPCRGCGSTSLLYNDVEQLHDEALCMRSHKIRCHLGLPVGTLVVFDDGFDPFGVRGRVAYTASVPWDHYTIEHEDDDRQWTVLPDRIDGVLPPDNADSEALERWLVSD
jgi:hypothetical protein